MIQILADFPSGKLVLQDKSMTRHRETGGRLQLWVIYWWWSSVHRKLLNSMLSFSDTLSAGYINRNNHQVECRSIPVAEFTS